MTIEEELKILIKRKYKSIRAFTTEHSFAYTSIDNIFKRSLFSASFQLVSQICVALELDLNELANNNMLVSIHEKKIEYDPVKKNELSIEEEELINNYRIINNDGKKDLLQESRDMKEISRYKKDTEFSRIQKQA